MTTSSFVDPDAFISPVPGFNADEALRAWVTSLSHVPAVDCAVVQPCDEVSLRGALEAAERGVIRPVLLAPEAKLRALAERLGLSLAGVRVVPVAHSHEAAERAAQMAADGEVRALLKGSLHSDEILGAVIANKALRTKRRLSHAFHLHVPTYSKPLLLADAAVNIAPTLDEKVDIVQNTICLAHALGVPQPKVALLAAVETVTTRMASTIDAAALCKMADRGQIRGGVLDGPLAFDNAISSEAAHIKGIVSPVAGDPDILFVPDIEAGNMVAKLMEYLAGAGSAGVVLGARVPIALTSRSGGPASRVASAMLAALMAHHGKEL